MSTDIPIVGLQDSIEHCMHLMDHLKSRYLLAFGEKKRLAGVITIHDILRFVLRERGEVFDREMVSRLVDEDESGRVY